MKTAYIDDEQARHRAVNMAALDAPLCNNGALSEVDKYSRLNLEYRRDVPIRIRRYL